MKRLCIILVLLALLLCSCVPDAKEGYVAESATDSEDGSSSADYERIERFQSSGYCKQYFAKENDTCVLSLDMPLEWTLRRVDGRLDILRNDSVIGSICSDKAQDTEEWTEVSTDKSDVAGISFEKYIERQGKGDDSEYRYRFVYKYKDISTPHTVTLCVALSEVDKMTESKIELSALVKNKKQSDTLGVLSDIKDASSILILGNSFIGTSDIEAILYEMLYRNGKNCHVLGLSRGYATVETYINDTALMREVRSGLYDAVFICGFYNSSEIDNLRILKNECDASKTKLVIFPAHNENSGVISQACRKFPELTCLNWKNEIDSLIKDGVSRSQFCINDQHQHSTPLAGYVGAHMIYRALYGTVPAKPYINAIEHSLVDKLGDYVTKGDVVEIDTAKINILG